MTNKSITIFLGIFLSLISFLLAYKVYKSQKIGTRWSGRIIKLNKKQTRNKVLELIFIGIMILILSSMVFFLQNN